MSTNTLTEQIDLRVRRTHKLLWDALLAELSARPFEEVTVSAICERAMVHRTTFYKHYADKYALLETGIRNIYAALIGDSQHFPPTAYSADNPPPYFVRLFEHAAQHERFYRLMLSGAGVQRFQQLLRESIVEFASAQWADPDQRMPLHLHAEFMAGGTLSVLGWWLEEGQPFSPRQMAAYLVDPHRA